MTPALEHARVLENKKLTAMDGQNHMAHIEAHILFVQNPAVNQNPEFYANVVQDVMQHIGFLAQQQGQQAQQAQPQQIPQGFADGGFAQPVPQLPQQQPMQQGPSVEEVEAQLIAEILPRLAPPQPKDPLVELQDKQIEMQRENNQLDYNADMARVESQEDIAAAKITADIHKADQKASIDATKAEMAHVEKITQNIDSITGNLTDGQ